MSAPTALAQGLRAILSTNLHESLPNGPQQKWTPVSVPVSALPGISLAIESSTVLISDCRWNATRIWRNDSIIKLDEQHECCKKALKQKGNYQMYCVQASAASWTPGHYSFNTFHTKFVNSWAILEMLQEKAKDGKLTSSSRAGDIPFMDSCFGYGLRLFAQDCETPLTWFYWKEL